MTLTARVLVALVVFALLAFYLHERFDGAGRPEAAKEQAPDIDASYRQFLLEGDGYLESWRAELGLGSELARSFASLLPPPSEPWRATLKSFRADKSLPRPASSFSPQGLVASGRARVGWQGEPTQRFLRWEKLGSGIEPLGLEIESGALLPAEARFESGARYRLRFYDSAEAPEAAGETLVQVIGERDAIQFRGQLRTLKRALSDPPLRRAAQGVLALSGGLYEAAADLLNPLPNRSANGKPLVAIIERKIFLCLREGRLSEAEKLAAMLPG